MATLLSESRIYRVIDLYGQAAVLDALVFVFKAIINQIEHDGIAIPDAWDEIHEWMELIGEPFTNESWQRILALKTTLMRNSVNTPRLSLNIWFDVGEIIQLISNVYHISLGSYAVPHIRLAIVLLAQTSNLLQGIPADRIEGQEIVGNLMMDRLQGKL